MGSELNLIVNSAFLGTELLFTDGPLTVTIDESGVISNISRGVATGKNSVDLRGFTAIPSLVNSHVHLLDAKIMEEGWDLDIDSVVGEPYGLKYILLKSKFRELRGAIEVGARLVRSYGVGVLLEFREWGLKVEELRVRKDRYHVVLGMPSSHNEGAIAEVGEGLRFVDGVAISSPHYFSGDVLARIAGEVKSGGKLLATHLAEVPESREGLNVVDLVKSIKPDVVVHGVWLSREELELIKDLGGILVLCPRSNLWFAGKLPDLKEIYESGIPVGLGTDNLGWVKPDIWRDLELLFLYARLRGVSDPKWALESVTTGLNDSGAFRKISLVNELSEGSPANITLLRANALGINSIRNKYLAVVKRGGAEVIGATIVGGSPEYCSREAETLCDSLRNILSRR